MTVASKPATQRLRINLRGAVQGVGFRPFVYRLATELSLTGWVLNSSSGLIVEVEGPAARASRFRTAIGTRAAQSIGGHRTRCRMDCRGRVDKF